MASSTTTRSAPARHYTRPRPPAPPVDPMRSQRRFAILFAAVLLIGSLSFIAWKIWGVANLAGILRDVPVVVEAPANIHIEVTNRTVEGHQGPGDSAYFDVHLALALSRSDDPPDGEDQAPEITVQVEGLLVAENSLLAAFAPLTVDGITPGERREIEIVCTPVHRPAAELARSITVRVR